MSVLGEAKVKITGDLKPLNAAFRRARNLTSSAVKSIGRTIFKGITGAVKKAARVVKQTVKIIIAAIVAIGVASVKMAMDAEESENLFEVSMENMSKAARRWSDELSKSLGLNSFEVRKMISILNVMLKSMGLTADEAAKVSSELTHLAFDMASFYNLKPEEAFQKIQAGITGEIEPLKRLGIIVNETTVKQWALNKGIIKGTEKLSEIQKVMGRYALIMGQTKTAQGDLERTLDSTTNVFRTIKSQLAELGVQIGNVFKDDVTNAAVAIRDWLVESKGMIIDWAVTIKNVLVPALIDAWKWIKDIFDLARQGKWKEVFQGIGDLLKDAFTIAMDFIMPKAKEIGLAIGEYAASAIREAFGFKPSQRTIAKEQIAYLGEHQRTMVGKEFPEASKGQIDAVVNWRRDFARGTKVEDLSREHLKMLKRLNDDLCKIEKNTRTGAIGP